jgi:aromatic-L-amino-acid decarboxylase
MMLDRITPQGIGPTTAASALQRAIHHATCYLDDLENRPVAPTVGLDELRARLGGEVPEHGMNPSRVVDELVANAEGGQIGSTGGRFFAW